MGAALLKHCNQDDPTYQQAAASCIALMNGEGDPEVARTDFIAAMEAAVVFVRE